MSQQKLAVDSGLWPIFRYNPELREQNKNPMILDFKKPDFSKVRDFLLTQSRFGNLLKVNAEHAESLYAKAAKDSRKRFMRYARTSGDLDKYLEREVKVLAKKNPESEGAIVATLPTERKKRPVDPEREARRSARKAEREAKK